MVYNTTDKKSSLSIADLTLDCEYLVIVAGRDSARRLGQESEELRISLNCKFKFAYFSKKLMMLHTGKIDIGNIEYSEGLIGQKIGLLIQWKVYLYHLKMLL